MKYLAHIRFRFGQKYWIVELADSRMVKTFLRAAIANDNVVSCVVKVVVES